MNVKQLISNSLILLGLTLGGISCSTPVQPQDETINKLHDDPSRAVFTLTEGRLEGTKFISSGTTQVIAYESKGGWGVAADSPKKSFEVKADKTTAYFLQISYLNKMGEDITSGFVTDGQENIHQHFFIATDFDPAKKSDGTTFVDGDASLYDYVYLDTKPWNVSVEKGATLLGADNPIGMKGAFHFMIPGVTFQMKVMLMHARATKRNEKNQFSPYNRPTKSQIANMPWDVQTKLQFTTV